MCHENGDLNYVTYVHNTVNYIHVRRARAAGTAAELELAHDERLPHPQTADVAEREVIAIPGAYL